MRLLVQHTSSYLYRAPALLGPHVVRLKPAQHTRTHVESYSLQIPQADGVDHGRVRWQQDPAGNHLARVTFKDGLRLERFDVVVELALDVHPVNPFDFFVDEFAETVPFDYPEELHASLAPFRDGSVGGTADPAYATGDAFDAFVRQLPESERTVAWLVELARVVACTVSYVIREEAGIWTPEETLTRGRGSCRDSAVLLVAAMRRRGLAARFVSGYLIQLTDEGMIPDQPRGVDRDVVDLHAWAEVYLPGAGWIGLDGTSGLFCGEGHIPLACTASPRLASPIEGSSDVAASEVSFEMKVGRLGHEVRPTAPYTEPVWRDLIDAARAADARLTAAGVTLTLGGEPTFNSRDHAAEPEWLGAALGPTKWTQGVRLTEALRDRLAPGAALLLRQGKHYPGESMPRWALDVIGRRDGAPVWPQDPPAAARQPLGSEAAEALARAIATGLGVQSALQPAYEDPWHHLLQEAQLPVDVDPLEADLDDTEDRRRLARLLDRGLSRPSGWVLPLTRVRGRWLSAPWVFRRSHLFLVPGDSPVGLRLPLNSLPESVWTIPGPLEDPIVRDDPRGGKDRTDTRSEVPDDPRDPAATTLPTIRTALCVEARDGLVHVFLPPVWTTEDFFDLVRVLDGARAAAGLAPSDVRLEGYPPPGGDTLVRFSITPDPGVLEVNIAPVASTAEYAALIETVFDAALSVGLHAEKYLVDGRQQGSGGGNHITLGGPVAVQSPMLVRPDLLASLITFTQHHPSLSYMFSGLFVGPTSQAPRVDEARHDSLYELEIALRRAHETLGEDEPAPPWLGDQLFRHLMVDLAGNTHRAEICLDKLFDPGAAHGRQGLVELRAFEMPPHPRMATAQVALVRALVAAFVDAPYRHPLIRHGQALHDRYLLPYWLWRDFEDALAWLAEQEIDLPADAYRPFVELRCPVAGRLVAGDVVLEVRNALEPWNVLGEELSGTGTARYVDSSMERVELRLTRFIPERHQVCVNGLEVPLQPTGVDGEYVGGVRFRAWAPPHSLHPHIGIHHPLRIDVVDRWARRSLGGCAYHVWHPEGRTFDAAPLTRFEASARRAQRFTLEGPLPWPVDPRPLRPNPDQPYTLDLRRYDVDRPMPEAPAADDPEDAGDSDEAAKAAAVEGAGTPAPAGAAPEVDPKGAEG